MISKVQLRKHLQTLRKGLSTSEVRASSMQIFTRLSKLAVYRQSRSLGLYDALDFEVQTNDIFDRARAQGKDCYYPKVCGQVLQFAQVDSALSMRKGKFGAYEPATVAPSEPVIDCMLVPCLGVDSWGHRLGVGGGYYDRYLADFTGVKIALAFDQQLYPTLPHQAHDINMDIVITPRRTYVMGS